MFATPDLNRATVRGGQAMATRIWTRRAATVGERAQAWGLSAPTGRLWVGGAQQATAVMCERGFQSLGSGARALR
eukprot:6208007-Pleurochrysis_carterae.AAC.1